MEKHPEIHMQLVTPKHLPIESQFKSASDVLNFLSTNDPEGYAKIIATVYDGWVSKPTTDEVT